MNQTQRNFLIKKIEATRDEQIKSLEYGKQEHPNLGNYILHEVMSGRIELQSSDYIKSVITQMALNAKAGSGWMNQDRWGDANPKIAFKPSDIFIIPESFRQLQKSVRENNEKIADEVRNIAVQADALILRIQLASDKTLQTMINEVDDMGNLSLMDTKIKQITNG